MSDKPSEQPTDPPAAIDHTHCREGAIVRVKIAAHLSSTRQEKWREFAIDTCIASIVDALQRGGIDMLASCCGHGKTFGRIDLADGRVLVVLPDHHLAPDFDSKFSANEPYMHINTRDENGVKQPLNQDVSKALADAGDKIRQRFASSPGPQPTDPPASGEDEADKLARTLCREFVQGVYDVPWKSFSARIRDYGDSRVRTELAKRAELRIDDLERSARERRY